MRARQYVKWPPVWTRRFPKLMALAEEDPAVRTKVLNALVSTERRRLVEKTTGEAWTSC